MSVLTDRFMLDTHTIGHAALSNALDVAAKVHALLPGGVTLRAWTLLPCEVAGEVVSLDDKTAIGWIVWLSQQPGWQFEESLLKRSSFLSKPYVTIAAVTDVDKMPVRIWAHVTAELQKSAVPTITSQKAAVSTVTKEKGEAA